MSFCDFKVLTLDIVGTCIAAAKTLGLISDDAAGDRYFRSFFASPAFPASADALKRLRRKFRLVAMTNYDRVAYTNCANKLGLPRSEIAA